MAQEPESDKPGTNVGGLFRPHPVIIGRLWILPYCPGKQLLVLERPVHGGLEPRSVLERITSHCERISTFNVAMLHPECKLSKSYPSISDVRECQDSE